VGGQPVYDPDSIFGARPATPGADPATIPK
jgi:hypothetical protein